MGQRAFLLYWRKSLCVLNMLTAHEPTTIQLESGHAECTLLQTRDRFWTFLWPWLFCSHCLLKLCSIFNGSPCRSQEFSLCFSFLFEMMTSSTPALASSESKFCMLTLWELPVSTWHPQQQALEAVSKQENGIITVYLPLIIEQVCFCFCFFLIRG